LCILLGTIKYGTVNGRPLQEKTGKQQLDRVKKRCFLRNLAVFKHRAFSVKSSNWKRQLRKVKRVLEDNIEMELKESRCDDVNFVELAQDRVHWAGSFRKAVNL
jgi:hypothetical protein